MFLFSSRRLSFCQNILPVGRSRRWSRCVCPLFVSPRRKVEMLTESFSFCRKSLFVRRFFGFRCSIYKFFFIFVIVIRFVSIKIINSICKHETTQTILVVGRHDLSWQPSGPSPERALSPSFQSQRGNALGQSFQDGDGSQHRASHAV